LSTRSDLLSVNVLDNFSGVGQRAFARERDGFIELGVGFFFDFAQLVSTDTAIFRDEFLEADKGASRLPFLDFFRVAIGGVAEESLLADDVPFPSVGLAFEKRRTLAGP